MTIKILNLYAGIGGNRKLWPNDDIEVTAVEINPEIAKIYQDFFPQDKMVVGDAHQYLLDHYKEFDFIWSSPPCPSHSRVRRLPMQNGITHPAIYPDMKLYEEILFLQGYFKGKYCVENVRAWYKPLIYPYELERHWFWSNFPIPKKDYETMFIVREDTQQVKQERIGFDLSDKKGIDKTKVLRNCVNPKVGDYIFRCAFKEKQTTIEILTPKHMKGKE